MGLLNWLGFGKKEKKIIKYDLDVESIKSNNIIRGQSNQIAELQAELARFKADQSKRKEVQQQKEEEEQIKSHLQREKIELDKTKSQKFFSLKAFFQRYSQDKNFRENLRITSFDRAHDLAKFGDWGFSGNSFVLLDDKRKVVCRMKELKDIFQSVNALPGDIKAMKIPINLDKDGDWIENLMVWDTPEIIEEDDETYRYSKARKRKFYKLLAEKNAQIQKGYTELEEAETAITKLQDKLDELEISYESNEKSGQIARAERVKTAETVSNIEKIWRETETELTKMRQMQVIAEDNALKLENQLKIMMGKAEGEETKLAFEKALEEVERIRSTLVREMPEKVVQTQIIDKKS